MILIALGANLPSRMAGPPRETCEKALVLLAGRGVAVIRRSRWYRSRPVPPSGQPDFVNGVALVESRLDPEALMALLHDIEDGLGRIRGAPNAAREIDLDLLAWGGVVIGDPEVPEEGVVLPHPRLRERAFVLLPLGEVAPGWRHPATGEGLDALIAALPDGQVCEPLE